MKMALQIYTKKTLFELYSFMPSSSKLAIFSLFDSKKTSKIKGRIVHNA